MPPKNSKKEVLFVASKNAYPARHKSAYVMASLFIIILAGGYMVFQASAIFVVPELVVNAPHDGEQIKSDSVTIRGVTQAKVPLTVNGYETYSNDQGNFELSLPFTKGYHILDIRVKNRIGKESRVVRHIVVE